MGNPISKKTIRQLLQELCDANWPTHTTSPSEESIRNRIDITEREILRRMR